MHGEATPQRYVEAAPVMQAHGAAAGVTARQQGGGTRRFKAKAAANSMYGGRACPLAPHSSPRQQSALFWAVSMRPERAAGGGGRHASSAATTYAAITACSGPFHLCTELQKALCEPAKMVLSQDIDLLNPPAELEKQKHKLKRLVQSPNSFFMVSDFAATWLARSCLQGACREGSRP